MQPSKQPGDFRGAPGSEAGQPDAAENPGKDKAVRTSSGFTQQGDGGARGPWGIKFSK